MELYNDSRRWGMPSNWTQLPCTLIEAVKVIEDAHEASSILDAKHAEGMKQAEKALR